MRAATVGFEVDRETVLSEWVTQPPAAPIVQYLRDAERERAIARIGDQSPVLDVSSETAVTTALDAEDVTRLDFSDAASRRARDVLDTRVRAYETTVPETPRLSFEDDTFAAAVSIGPYDWKFLDLECLTSEIHRVLDENGVFVFSMPTPRSPYFVGGKHRYRYYPVERTLDLVAPDWRLLGEDLLFQYPYTVHRMLRNLPARLQEPFVDLAWRFDRELTARDLRDCASYLVCTIQPLAYQRHLDSALDCLFRPTTRNGFWDEGEKKIVRALEYTVGDDAGDVGFTWSADDSVEWRYAPFALLGAMQWRTSTLGDARYDDKLIEALGYFVARLDGPVRTEMPSYGVGTLLCAFSLAIEAFGESDTNAGDATAGDATASEANPTAYEDAAWTLFERSRGSGLTHAEDSLLVYGWSSLYEHAHRPTHEVRAAITDGLWRLTERLDADGRFTFENPTTHRHQNQLYALWGYCRAVEITGASGYLDNAVRVLDRAIETRMRSDGAFVWGKPSLQRRVHGMARNRLGGRVPYWELLFSCHQTFFVNAVSHYYRACDGVGDESVRTERKNYDRAVARAMSWIHGDSARGDLAELGGLGVPMRHLTVDGRFDAEGQQFKGSYEVGSYIMALSNLLDGPFRSWT